MPLTDAQCRAPNRTGSREKRSDGGGLYLAVSPTGSRRWELAYRMGGKQCALPIGPYPGVGLAEARLRREEAKVTISLGRDPAAPAEAESAVPTLVQATEHWIDVAGARWTPRHRARVEARMRRDLFPRLGSNRLDKITTPDVLAAVRDVEERGAHDIAHRLAQAVAGVYRLAIAEGHVTVNPAGDLRGSVKARPPVKHRAMIAPKDMAVFFSRLDAYDGGEITRLALEAVVRTAVRSAELREAVWSEIEGDLWRIPADRMKMDRPHIVPLPPVVQALFARAKKLGGGSPYIFPGERGQPLSVNTLLGALWRIGYNGRATVHGFRGSFPTWANEQGRWAPDVIERQLAHIEGSAVRRAYDHSQHLPARRELMLAWNEWLDQQRAIAELL